MHPCLPKSIPNLPGCCVRLVATFDAKGPSRFSLTYWFAGRAFQTTVIRDEAPDLLAVMTHFDRHPDRWTAVSAPLTGSAL